MKNSRFPIFFWNFKVSSSNVTKQNKKDWEDACFSAMMIGVDDTSPKGIGQTRELLDWCKDRGMLCIVCDPRVQLYTYGIRKDYPPEGAVLPEHYRREVAKAARDFGDHPAVYAFDILDEPGRQAYSVCVEAAHIVREITGKEPYINMKPYYFGVNPKLREDTYHNYLKKFAAESDVSILSFDYYGQVSENNRCDPDYWYTLHSNMETAKEMDIEMWNIILSIPVFNYRSPSYDDLRFEVNTALAYGSKSICYFTLDTPNPGGGGESNFRQGPINWWGERTPLYDAIRDVNRELHGRWGDLFCELKLSEAYHFPYPPHPSIEAFENNDFVWMLNVLKGGEQPHLVISNFIHRATCEKYVFIVNASVTDSALVRIWYTSAKKTYSFLLDGSEVPTADGVDPETGRLSADIWLAPGQGELFRLED